MTAVADRPAPVIDEPAEDPRPVSLVLRAAVVGSYFGVVVLSPALPHNTAFVDPLLAALSFGALLSMGRHGSEATEAGVKALPWIWIILLGSLLGLFGVGLAAWGVSDLIVGLFAFLTFFCMWHLVDLHHLERYAVWGTALGLAITTVTVVTDGALRNKGLFHQPNYPADYAVLAMAVLVYACKHRWAKVLAVVALLVVVKETGSFGSLLMVATMLAILLFRAVTRFSAILAVFLVAVIGVGSYVVANYVTEGTSGISTQVPTIAGTGIYQARLDKSKGERTQLWTQDIKAWEQNPFGVGPAGVVNRQLATLNGDNLQVHNDALSYLVERGPIGLIGFIGLWVVLWRCAKKRGFARLMIITILVSGVVRQVMHYRHVWLLLALAYVFDARQAKKERDEQAALQTAELVEVSHQAQLELLDQAGQSPQGPTDAPGMPVWAGP